MKYLSKINHIFTPFMQILKIVLEIRFHRLIGVTRCVEFDFDFPLRVVHPNLVEI